MQSLSNLFCLRCVETSESVGKYKIYTFRRFLFVGEKSIQLFTERLPTEPQYLAPCPNSAL